MKLLLNGKIVFHAPTYAGGINTIAALPANAVRWPKGAASWVGASNTATPREPNARLLCSSNPQNAGHGFCKAWPGGIGLLSDQDIYLRRSMRDTSMLNQIVLRRMPSRDISTSVPAKVRGGFMSKGCSMVFTCSALGDT